jgi:hypothetical protein
MVGSFFGAFLGFPALPLLARNTVIQTFPAVSQFWKYPPDAFLKEPAYSRDYPPCRHC